jgi:methylated-DNA-[protein]-cysteine S-methyltransferase
MKRSSRIIPSPVGNLELIAEGDELVGIRWTKSKSQKSSEETSSVLEKTARQLEEYFSGERKKFDLPLKFIGTTFQKSVWRALQSVPYGQTQTYSDIAVKIKSPKAQRAVGGANNKNPLPIVVPCHRIIGRDKTLVGFGGGLENKAYLLELEKRVERRVTSQPR